MSSRKKCSEQKDEFTNFERNSDNQNYSGPYSHFFKTLTELQFAHVVAGIVRTETDAENIRLWGPLL